MLIEYMLHIAILTGDSKSLFAHLRAKRKSSEFLSPVSIFQPIFLPFCLTHLKMFIGLLREFRLIGRENRMDQIYKAVSK